MELYLTDYYVGIISDILNLFLLESQTCSSVVILVFAFLGHLLGGSG